MQEQINCIPVLDDIKIENEITVKELLEKLGINNQKYFAVLVNGRKVGPDYKVRQTDKVIVLPLVAGG